MGTEYFLFALLIFFLVFSFRILVYFIKKFLQTLGGGNQSSSNYPGTGILLQKSKSVFPLIKLFLGIALFFSSLIGILGFLAFSLKDRLVNNDLMRIDKLLLGQYPFIWLQTANNFFKIFDKIILISFNSIGLSMSIALFIFYLSKNRKFLSWYVMSIPLACIISLPFWFAFPANSPQNAFLSNVYNKKINAGVKESLDRYQPTSSVSYFQSKVGEMQRKRPPISTMPSMHVAWAIIIAFLTFKLNKKLAFLFFPWAIFSAVGTVYLAQHYFIDIIAAVPVALASLWISSLLLALEKKYYQNPAQDSKENQLKSQIRSDLNKLILPFKLIASLIAERILNNEKNELTLWKGD